MSRQSRIRRRIWWTEEARARHFERLATWGLLAFAVSVFAGQVVRWALP